IIWSVKTVSFLLLLGVIELFSVYFYMKMHQFSHVSVSTIVLRLRLVWIPLLAFLFVGERLSYVNYMGIFTIFFGLSLVTTPKEFFYDKGIKLAFLCSFITAVLAVIVKIISPYVSASIIVLAMSIPPVFLFPFFVKDWKKRTKDFYSKNITGVTTAVVANALSMYFQVQSLKIGNVSQVQGVFQAVSLTTVLAGIFLLGEKEKIWQKLIGSAIVLVGVYLLI
ncbi:MAG: EamA family transporter, partial [Microgenomates group bacterium]